MQIIDFSKYPRFCNEIFTTDADNGDRVYGNVLYGNGVYFLQFWEQHAWECFSRYIGCHVFDILGVPSQETLLGVINYKGRQQIAVASRLPNVDSKYFYNWRSIMLGNGKIENFRDIDNIISELRQMDVLGEIRLESYVWTILAIDAYIGNYSHGDGYDLGLLIDRGKNYSLPPVSGCDKCLYSQQICYGRNTMNALESEDDRVFGECEGALVADAECFLINGKSLIFYELFRQMQDVEGLKALVKIAVLIMEKENDINKMIDEIALLPDREKSFYKGILHQRLEKVLLKAIENNAVCKSFC